MHKAAGLIDEDAVPDATGDDQRLVRPQRDLSIPVMELEPHSDAPGDEIQKLVGVGVHLPGVRRFSGEPGGTDRIAIDAGRPPLLPLHESGTGCSRASA